MRYCGLVISGVGACRAVIHLMSQMTIPTATRSPNHRDRYDLLVF